MKRLRFYFCYVIARAHKSKQPDLFWENGILA